MTRAEKNYITNSLKLCALTHKKEFSITLNDISVYVTWHSPSLNLNWYPIIEIQDDRAENRVPWRSIYLREGPENPECWTDFINDACRFIDENIEEE